MCITGFHVTQRSIRGAARPVSPLAYSIAAGCVFCRLVAIGIRPSAGFKVAAGRWRHRLAHTHRRTGVGGRAGAGGGSILLQPPSRGVVRLGMAGRRGIRGHLALARPGGRSHALWRGTGVSGHPAIGAHSAPGLGTVDRPGGDDGGGERFEHTLPGAAARLFDPVLHARVVDSGRRSRSLPAAAVAAGAHDRAVGESARRFCGVAGHAGASRDALGGAARVAAGPPLRLSGGAVYASESAESVRLATAPAHCALSEFVVDSGQRAGVSVSPHTRRGHDCVRPAAFVGGGASASSRPFRGAAGDGLGISGAALGAPCAVLRHCGRSRPGGGRGGVLGAGGSALQGALRGAHLLGTGAGIRTASTRQPMAAAHGRGGDGGRARRRLPGHGLSGAGGGGEPVTAGARRRHATHPDQRPMGRLPDLPPVSAATRLLRRAQRFLRSGDRQGLPAASGWRESVAGTAGALPFRPGAVAARLGAEHDARPGTRMAEGV